MGLAPIACIAELGLSAVSKQLDVQSKMWAYQMDLGSHSMKLEAAVSRWSLKCCSSLAQK